MNIDCHMHTSLCGHADGDPIDYVLSAARKHIRLITFTDHIPMSASGFGHRFHRMHPCQLSKYLYQIARARELGHRYGVQVLCGIEAEIFPDNAIMQEMDKLLVDQNFDFVLGSLHHHLDGYQTWLSNRNIHSEYDIIETYFEHVIEGIESGRYHSIAHLDVIKAYGTVAHFDPKHHERTILRLLEAAYQNQVCIEINTSQLRTGEEQLFPAPLILKWATEINNRFTLGSDAHHPKNVGRYYEPAAAQLDSLGIDRLYYFKKGTAHSVPVHPGDHPAYLDWRSSSPTPFTTRV